MKRDRSAAGLESARREPAEKRTKRQVETRPKVKKTKRRTKLRHNEDVPAMMICYINNKYFKETRHDEPKPGRRTGRCAQRGWLHMAIEVACRTNWAMDAQAHRLWGEKIWTREENRLNNEDNQHPDYPRDKDEDLGLAEYDGDDPVIYKQQQRLNHSVIWREACKRVDEAEKEEEKGVTYADRLEFLHYGWARQEEPEPMEVDNRPIKEESWD